MLLLFFQETITQKEVLDASFYIIASIVGFIVTCLFLIGGWFIGMILSRLAKAENDIAINREYFKDEIAKINSDLRSNTESDERIHKDISDLTGQLKELSKIVNQMNASLEILINQSNHGKNEIQGN